MDDALSRTFHALADPTRRAILDQIAGGASTVNDLVAANHLSQPGISKHLKVLEDAGLVRRGRVARTRPVHLAPEGLETASGWIEHTRRHWEGAFDRMDALLTRLKDEEAKNGRQ